MRTRITSAGLHVVQGGCIGLVEGAQSQASGVDRGRRQGPCPAWLRETASCDAGDVGFGDRRRECVIDLCVEVPLPAGAVYDFLADIQDVEPIPHRALVRMSKDPPGPTTRGTRWHESVRFAPGLWMHVESVVTEAARPQALAMTFHSRWWSGDLRYGITGTSQGCVLRHREVLVPTLVLQPVTGVIERRLRVTIQERLHDIRDVLVSGYRDPPAARRPG